MNTYIVGLKSGEKLKIKGFLKNGFEIGDQEGASGYNYVARFNHNECLYIIQVEHYEDSEQTPQPLR